MLDVPLGPIVDAFVAVLRDDAVTIDVADLSEFLLIASILLEMKSRSLLPGRDDTEPDEEFVGWEERDVLLARLLGAAHLRRAVRRVRVALRARRSGLPAPARHR